MTVIKGTYFIQAFIIYGVSAMYKTLTSALDVLLWKNIKITILATFKCIIY